ncbi:hypothetical protein ASE14_02130 [Agromyces sp. Root81]|uniref:hypothetical protein n=1 Tax=Agromyces sp. Root81 TaxID=1736601 RepID=UPI0006F9721D|nr:hypothetical protein [Agromyces sp. Root81]KRC62649.1 hypothetical protein ASE14_02130 [Agromyces sp. Root81]
MTAEFIDVRIADYGPEELVHDGLLLLNDDLNAAREGDPTSRKRFDAWQAEAELFDDDPALWNRNWAFNYSLRVLPNLKRATRVDFLNAMRDKLSDVDVEEITKQFDSVTLHRQ